MEGHFKNKRIPLDKCHLDLLPSEDSIPTMALSAQKHNRDTQTIEHRNILLLTIDESCFSNGWKW